MKTATRAPKVLLVGLYSARYPAIGESHGLSVIAGCLREKLASKISRLEVLDLVGFGDCRDDLVMDAVAALRPNILGIGVSYGTYEVLRRIYPKVKELIAQQDCLVVFGGALATYLPDTLLKAIDDSAVVVCGEGDQAVVELVDRWIRGLGPEGLANVCYRKDGVTVRESRKLVDLSATPLPYRCHANELAKNGAQIFVETSRGCSWAACTFCLRGLTDVNGRRNEYRRFGEERLRRDIQQLSECDVTAFTVADEDFLGGNFEECERVVTSFEHAVQSVGSAIAFDVSMTVQSVYSGRWDKGESVRRWNLLERLRDVGLRKVFLGVESGCSTQLKRYAKGHTKKECVQAARTLKQLDIALEVGFIMFDPLVGLDELHGNLTFLSDNGLVSLVSFLGNELRLQVGSRYVALLELWEKKHGTYLFDRHLDPDTLSYGYRYANPVVSDLVSVVRKWNASFGRLHYPMKNLSRYGEGGMLGETAEDVRRMVGAMRCVYAQRLLEAVSAAQHGDFRAGEATQVFNSDLSSFARRVVELFATDVQCNINHSLIESLVTTARQLSSHHEPSETHNDGSAVCTIGCEHS